MVSHLRLDRHGLARRLLVFVFFTMAAICLKMTGIPLFYGIELVFSGVFIYAILRLLGSGWAIASALAVNAFSFLILDRQLESVLLLAGAVTVALLCRYRPGWIVGWESLFWLVLGAPSLYLADRVIFHFSDRGMLFLIIIMAANGIFNAFLVDVLLTYVPVQKWLKLRTRRLGLLPNFHKVLFHVTAAGVMVPFILYLMIATSDVERSAVRKAMQMANSEEERITREYSSWPSNEKRALKLKGIIQQGYLQEAVDASPDYFPVNLFISDEQGGLLAKLQRGRFGDIWNRWLASGIRASVGEDLYKWVPSMEGVFKAPLFWRETLYVHEAELDDIYATFFIPADYFAEQAFTSYLIQLRVFALFVITIIIFSLLLNRLFVKSLSRLAQLTSDLPERFTKSGGDIHWPKSRIYEVMSLILNFKSMSDNLACTMENFKAMNSQLKIQAGKLAESEHQLYNLAFYDSLTGLPNRLHFANYFRQVIEFAEIAPNYRNIAVLLIDLDRFKHVNDTLGHAAGDLMLKAVSDRISALLDSFKEHEFFAARLGGDEFVLLLHDCTPEEARQAAQSVLECFAKPISVHDLEIYVTASIGISIYPTDGDTFDDLVKNADVSMYAAKEGGGGSYYFYTQGYNRRVSERMQMESSLRRALERKEFVLYFQPEVNTVTGRIEAVEALIRWDREGELVMPGQFISLAEKTGLIIPIGKWVLQEVCRMAKEWQNQGLPEFRVAVNWSAVQFQQGGVSDIVSGILEETGLEPQYLELEITEGCVISNPEYVTEELDKLRRLGVFIAIDDFGSGYSSLGLLRKLPISSIKIDRSFVSNIPQGDNTAIVRAIIRLAHDLGLGVTAEGVETAEELDYLRTLACDRIQGYIIERPLSHKALLDFIRKRISQEAEHEAGWRGDGE